MPGSLVSADVVAVPMNLRFDRRTVLLTDPPAGVNLGAAPGVVWDRRVRAYRAPAIKHSALQRWLFAAGIRCQDVAPRPRSRQEAWSAVELRSYQEAALSAWELAGRRGLVALPTGSGKTRLALAAMQR